MIGNAQLQKKHGGLCVCVCGGVLWAIIADNLWDIRDTRIGERERERE